VYVFKQAGTWVFLELLHFRGTSVRGSPAVAGPGIVLPGLGSASAARLRPTKDPGGTRP